MTQSSTQVSLANRALASFGARSTIASLTETSNEARNVNIFFQSTFESLARTARWGCLRREATLSLLAAAVGTPENPDGTTLPLPPQPFLYAYAMPADCLFVRGLQPFITYTNTGTLPLTSAGTFCTPGLPNSMMIPFKVGYSTDSSGNPIEIILTNLDQAIAVYTTNQPNPVVWDSLFENAFVSSLAAFLIPAISLNIPLMAEMIKSAQAAIMQARTADGNETPVNQNRQASWMTARHSGNCYGGGYNSCGYNYQDMAWPGASGGGIS